MEAELKGIIIITGCMIYISVILTAWMLTWYLRHIEMDNQEEGDE